MTERIPTPDELSAMSDIEFKVLENRLRRAADRQGYQLVKSRRRDPRAVDYGRYWLIELNTRGATLGGEWGTTLDDVAEYLWGDDA